MRAGMRLNSDEVEMDKLSYQGTALAVPLGVHHEAPSGAARRRGLLHYCRHA
jgi:hypothetical protein